MQTEFGKRKVQIENLLNAMELDKAYTKIEEYKILCPEDMDLLSFYCIYHLYCGNSEKSLQYAKRGVRRYPTSADMYYNLASVYEALGDLINCVKNYCIAGFFYKETVEHSEEMVAAIQQKIDYYLSVIRQKKAPENHNEKIKWECALDEFFCYEDDLWGIIAEYQSLERRSIGHFLWVGPWEKRYIGYVGKQLGGAFQENEYDLVKMKGEFLKVTPGIQYEINETEEYLLPIAVEKEYTVHNFLNENQEINVVQRPVKHFNYYRLRGKTSIVSSEKSYYGNPIPLVHGTNRKKLVLNIFVDGLTQEVFGDDLSEMAKYMPNTKRFFEKGVICTEAYSTAEWTYPTLAGMVSGLDTLHHKLFHSKYNTILPEDIPLLYEYFSEAGYYTAKIDGEWRSTPYYGYGRGIDRYVYQIQTHGARTEQELGDVIEHLRAFEETDQFLWICFGDLHDIADGFDFNTAVQTKLPVSLMEYEEEGITSVKQNYSEKKTEIYKEKLKYIDTYLGILYSYIESKYQEDEILISLFGDHGQGYLVPEGEHFLAKERSKVAFMFRGGKEAGICNELISTLDYTNILCKMAGIKVKEAPIQGQLPVFFGGDNEREYVIAESLHPGDPYQAAVHTKKFSVYYSNGENVRDDGRFHLKDEVIYAKTKNGMIFDDLSVIDKYHNILLERIAHLLIYE